MVVLVSFFQSERERKTIEDAYSVREREKSDTEARKIERERGGQELDDGQRISKNVVE